jgi:hypothetical protein
MEQRMRILLALLAIAFSIDSIAATATPEQCAAQLLEGYRTGNYQRVVETIDPSEIAVFSDNIRAVFKDRDGQTPNALRVALFGPDIYSERLLSMSDADLLALFLKGYMDVLGTRSNAAPVQISAFTVLGHVDEPPDLAHVVARVTVRDQSLSVTAIRPFTVKKVGNQWRAQLDDSAKALLGKLRDEAEHQQAGPQ